MAAIALSRRSLFGLLIAAVPGSAGKPRDVRATLVYVSSALANGNPSDAISMFAKTCPGYETLAEYFSTLTTGYEIASQIEITDETNSPKQVDIEATWRLTLTSRMAEAINQRSENVKIRFAATKPGKDPDWKIISFAPLDLFNPQ